MFPCFDPIQELLQIVRNTNIIGNPSLRGSPHLSSQIRPPHQIIPQDLHLLHPQQQQQFVRHGSSAGQGNVFII